MLSSPSPRSTPRTTHTHPTISFPVSSRPSSQSTIIAPASPPSTPPTSRRPSFSNGMPWLSRSSTQSSLPYSASKPTRISEPKLVRSIELVSQQRSGVLGSGATVVRTPDEALRETGVRLTFDGKGRNPEMVAASRKSSESRRSKSSDARVASQRPSVATPTSPPLPPLPMPEEENQELLDLEPADAPKGPPHPIRAPPPTPPPPPSLRSSLKFKSTASSSSDDSYQVPPLPANVSASPSPPPFRPILVSEVPTGAVDPSKIIVTLDTCTATYRTTLDTLRSRPSHLSSYLSSLFLAPERVSVSSSIYSTASDDVSVYRHHLTAQGLLSQASFSIHLFLDRPSAPYAHILNYLRSPADAPEVLPRSAQLQSLSHSRLEQLLELRDEAAYLNLEGLHKLCTDEIRLRHRDVARLHHTRGQSSISVNSIQSLRASVYGLHTLLERVESDIRSSQQDSSSIDSKGSKDGSPIERIPPRSLATPQSWNGPTLRGRSESKRRGSPPRSPPVGWI